MDLEKEIPVDPKNLDYMYIYRTDVYMSDLYENSQNIQDVPFECLAYHEFKIQLWRKITAMISKRDLSIFLARALGNQSYSTIGKRHDLSKERARQIFLVVRDRLSHSSLRTMLQLHEKYSK